MSGSDSSIGSSVYYWKITTDNIVENTKQVDNRDYSKELLTKDLR